MMVRSSIVVVVTTISTICILLIDRVTATKTGIAANEVHRLVSNLFAGASFMSKLSFTFASGLLRGGIGLEVLDGKETDEKANDELSSTETNADQPQVPLERGRAHELTKEFNSDGLEATDEGEDTDEVFGAGDETLEGVEFAVNLARVYDVEELAEDEGVEHDG